MKISVPALAFTAAVALVQQVAGFGCKPAEVKGWMAACDTVSGGSQAKCDNKLCHIALHRLVETETIECYVASGLGPGSDLAKYKTLDDFCHGEGPDPILTPAPTTKAPGPAPTTSSPAPGPIPTTPAPAPGPAPTTPAPAPGTPAPTTGTPVTTAPTTPVVTAHPSC